MPSRPGLGLSAVPVPSHFSQPESASTALGGTVKRRGAAREPPRAPLGGRTERRSSQRPGLGANRGSRAGSTRAPRPGHQRGSRRRTPRAAAPLAPRLARTSPRLGTLQLGGRAGRAREFPGETRSQARRQAVPGIRVAGAPRGPPRPPPPPRAVHPGRARAARRPLRQLHTEPGPRSPLTEAAAAPGRRSASLPPSQVSRALRPREATGGAHGRAGAGSSSACAAIAVASRVRGSAAMSARLTLSASLAARPPQPRSSLRRRVRGGRVPPLAAPRHSALQPSFLTLFCPSLPLSPRLFRVPGGSLELGSLLSSCRPPLGCSGRGLRGRAALKAERGRSSTRREGCLAPRTGALAFRLRPAAWTDCP